MTFSKSSMIYTPTIINNRHIGAAKRALKKEKEKAGLFPDLMRFNSIEERLFQKEENKQEFVKRMRSSDAKFWIKARKELATLPLKTQKRLLEKWNNSETRLMNAEAFRFASLVSDAVRYPDKFIHEQIYNDASRKTIALTCKLATTINTNGNIRKLRGFTTKLEQRYGVKVLTYTFSTNCLQVSLGSSAEVKKVMKNKAYIAEQLKNYFKDIGYPITQEIIFFNAFVHSGGER